MKIHVRFGNGWEKELSFTADTVSFGSHPQCDVVLPDPNIRAVYFNLSRKGKSLYCTPFAPGLTIQRNGQLIELTPNRETMVNTGDKVQIQDSQIEIISTTANRFVRFIPLIWAIVLCLILSMIMVFTRPRIESFISVTDSDGRRSIAWESGGMFADVSIDDGTTVQTVQPQGTLSLTDGAQGEYTLKVDNRLSRFFDHAARQTIVIPTVLQSPTPSPTVLPAESPVAGPIGLKLESEETDPNQVLLRWEIEAGPESTALLRIGTETILLEPRQFSGERSIRLTENIDVELIARNDRFEKAERLRLTYQPRKARIQSFIIWLETEPGAPKEKVAELLPDPHGKDDYRVQTYRTVNLKGNEHLLIEWDVHDADTLTIEPLSNRLLPLKGAIAYHPTDSVNFILTAFSGDQRLDASIPIRLERGATGTGQSGSGQTQRTQTPVQAKINFFKANPATLTQAGETTIAWSVSGPYQQIRIVDGEHEIAAGLPAAGMRKITVQDDLTLMLLADTPSGTISAIETVRVKSDTAVLRPTTIQFSEIFPKKSAYTVGDRVQISFAFTRQVVSRSTPTGSVLISDGVSSCVATLPRESCEILLRADGERSFTIRYSGDRSYSPSDTAVKLTVNPFVRQAVNLKLTTIRNQTVFAPGEKIRLIAEAEPGNITGTLYFSDGVRSCLTTLPRNSCELIALEPGSTQISVNYSGDDKHEPAQDFLTVVSSLIEPTITPTPIPLVLEISQLYPLKEAYAIGDAIDVYISLTNNAGLDNYKNRVRISDGTSVCYLNPNTANHCSLRLVQARHGQIQAEYPGDERIGGAKSSPVEILVLPEALATGTPPHPLKATSLTITKIYPERPSFTIGDTIEVYVSLTNEDGTEAEYSGRIRISDGIAACTLNPNLTNSCSLKLVQPQTGKLTAVYSGDDTYSPAQSETPLIVKPAVKFPTRTVITAVEPRKNAYELNEEIAVKVDISEKDTGSRKKPTGIVRVQAGTSECEIDLILTDTCSLALADPNTVEITAKYEGDSFFTPSDAQPIPLRIRLMAMTLQLLAETYTNGDCQESQPDLSAPIPLMTTFESGTEIRLFTLDERFFLGRGFYLDAEIERTSGLFENFGGTMMVSVCPDSKPDHCIESGAISVEAPSQPNARLSVRIHLPSSLFAGRHHLTATFRSADPTIGTVQEQAILERIYPGQLIPVPTGGHIDWAAQKVTASGVDAAPERDQTLVFDVYQIRDRATGCALPLASDFPKPAFSTMDVRVADSVPGAAEAESNAIWQQTLRDQGLSDEIIGKLQPNRMNWDGDRCQFQRSADHWQISCRLIGLTEPSHIIFSGDVNDPNYQTAETEKFPIELTIRKNAVAIIPAPGWREPNAGKVYWLNARGDDFTYWPAEDCNDSNMVGFQTSVARIPPDQVLTIDAKLLSRAMSDQLRLRDAEGFVTITPASASQWTMLPTYHGICGSCNPRVMMDYAWIANEGCSVTGNSLTLTTRNGKLYNGQTCENYERKHVQVRSDFCQIKVNESGDIIFDLSESDSQLAAALRLTGGRGRGLIPFMEPMSAEPFRAELTVLDSQSQPLQTLSVGETAHFRVRLNRPMDRTEKIDILVPSFFNAENIVPEPSSCLNWSSPDPSRWTLDAPLFIAADDDVFHPQADCTLTFNRAVEFAAGPILQIQYPDGAVTDWEGFPAAIQKQKMNVVPSLRLVRSSDTDDAGREQIAAGQIERLYSDDANPALDPLAQYQFSARLSKLDGTPSDDSALETILIRSEFLSKLGALGTLDDCWGNVDMNLYRLRVGESCGFRIPPRGLSQSDFRAFEISIDSPRFEGSKTISINEHALESEAITIRVFAPLTRRIGENSEIRFTIDPDHSEYAAAWIARNRTNLLSVVPSENLAENCSAGLPFDTNGTAVCFIGNSFPNSESQSLMVHVGDLTIPEQLGIRLVNGDSDTPLEEIVLPPVRAAELNGSVLAAGISDQIVVENDILIEFRLSADPNIADQITNPDEIVRIEAPIFHADDADGTCSDIAALPWIEDKSGAWVKQCDFRISAARSLTEPESTISLTTIDERFEFPPDTAPSLALPSEVSRQSLRLTTVLSLPTVRIGSEPIYWTIQIDSNDLTIDPDLWTVRANDSTDLDCQFSDDFTVANCALYENLPEDTIRLQAAYSGDTLLADAILNADPIRKMRFELTAVPLEPPTIANPVFLPLPLPEELADSENYLYREDIDQISFHFFSLTSNAQGGHEACAAPPQGFILEAEVEQIHEVKRLSFDCLSPQTFTDSLLCEISEFENPEFDPDSLRRIHSLALTFPGDDCFDPFELDLGFDSVTIIDFIPIETIVNSETIEIDVPDFEWESLTVYCDQDGVPLRCEADGYERDCWGIPAQLPIRDGFISIAAANAYAPNCQWIGTVQNGQILHGGTSF